MTPDFDLARGLISAPRWVWTLCTPVVESGESGMAGCRGVIVPSSQRPGELAVRWAGNPLQPKTWMETCITHGTVPDLDHFAAAGVLMGMLAAEERLAAVEAPTEARPWVVEYRGQHLNLLEGKADTSLGRAAARAWLALQKERT